MSNEERTNSPKDSIEDLGRLTFSDEVDALVKNEGGDLSILEALGVKLPFAALFEQVKPDQCEPSSYSSKSLHYASVEQVGEEDIDEDEFAMEDELPERHVENLPTLTNVSLAGNEYDELEEEEREEAKESAKQEIVSLAGPLLKDQKSTTQAEKDDSVDSSAPKSSTRKELPRKDMDSSRLKHTFGSSLPSQKRRKEGKKGHLHPGRKDMQHELKHEHVQSHAAGTPQDMDIVSKIVEDDTQKENSFLDWNNLWCSKTAYRTEEMQIETFPADLLLENSVLAIDLRNWEDDICWDSWPVERGNEDDDDDVEWEIADENTMNEDKSLFQNGTISTNIGDIEAETTTGEPMEDTNKLNYFTSQSLVVNPFLDNSLWLQDDLLEHCGLFEGSNMNASLSSLIVNLNDDSIIYESWNPTKARKLETSASSKSWVFDDRASFNISNDEFYDSADKLIRHFVSHGLGKLEHAAFWKQGVFLPRLPTEEAVEHFHRPKLQIPSNLLNKPLSLLYPCIPEEAKSNDFVHSFENFANFELSQNVILVEYGLEHTPVLLPLPGMASRLVRYTRLKTGDTKTKEEGHFSTNLFHNVYLAPEEPPPLCSGDIKPGQSVTILESSLFIAPAEIITPKKTDFLLTLKPINDNSYSCFIRKIDHVVTVGQTEPRMNVMAPNTDRFRKFVRDRVLLYVVLECLRIRNENLPLELSRSQVDEEFFRNSFPRSAVERTIKELARLEKGVFKVSEPKEGFEVLRDMLLKSVTPEVLSSYESMEYGWSIIQQFGVTMFTHPTAHGDLINAGEKAGPKDGKEVADYIRRVLYRTPWFRAEEMIKLQKKQLREINRCLARASIGIDLMDKDNLDTTIDAMTYPQLRSALIFHFHIPGRKIPTNVDHAREMARRLARKRAGHGLKKKQKAVIDYHHAIIDGFKRFKDTRNRAGLVPLESQLLALRDSRLEKVNLFMERFRRFIRSVRKGAITSNLDAEMTKQGTHSEDDEKKALEDFSKERFMCSKRLPNLPERVYLIKKKKDPATGEIQKFREVVTDPERIQRLLIKCKQKSRKGNVKVSVPLKKLARGAKPARPEKRKRPSSQPKMSRGNAGSTTQAVHIKYTGVSNVKQISARDRSEAPKRAPRKTPIQQLNDLFLRIVQCMENARGYNESIFDNKPGFRIFLVTEDTPEDRKAASLNLAIPEDTGVDLVHSLDRNVYKEYFKVIEKEMNLSIIRQKCVERKYRSVKDFMADIDLMLRNAKKFHSRKSSSWVILHVELLKQIAERELNNSSDELARINDRIQKGRKAEIRRRQRRFIMRYQETAKDAPAGFPPQNSIQANSSGGPVSYSSVVFDRREVNDNESVHLSSNHMFEERENEQDYGCKEDGEL